MTRARCQQMVFAMGQACGGFRGPSLRLGLAAGLLLVSLAGCVTPAGPDARRAQAINAAARPLLEMQPDVNWTACYNRLVEIGPASIDYLVSEPIMHRRAAPDDLRVMLHTSLLRVLANPAAAPRLSVNCFETTLDVLHFDPNVRGRRLGEVCLRTPGLPAAWHDLYPAEFDHALAAEIDPEADRQAVLRWWEVHRAEPAFLLTPRRLQPRAAYLWAVLPRRYADVWTYELKAEVLLCAAQPPTGSALLRGKTYDYNLVRAVCIWLASSEAPGVQGELIELVAHPSQVVAYNARFALQYSPDPRIREVLERYNEAVDPTAPTAPYDSVGTSWLNHCPSRAPLSSDSCDAQGSATHEMDQVHAGLCGRDRCGDLYRGQVRRH